MYKAMKFLFVSALFLSLSACGDDEESVTDVKGEWTCRFFAYIIETTTTNVTGMVNMVRTLGTGTSCDTEIIFDGSNFGTSGEYSYDTSTESNGMIINNSQQTATNVSGFGAYSISGDVITTDRAIFELEADGADFSALEGEQSAMFVIGDDRLTINQEEETTSESQGITVVTRIVSITVWMRE